MKIIPITSDTMFKTMVKKDIEYTKILLSMILGLDYKNLLDISFENNELEIDKKNDKRQYADIIIKHNNEYINLEMNKFYHKYVSFRNLLYLYKISLKDVKNGEPYDDKKGYVQINFNNFNSGDKIVNKYVYREVEMGDILINNFTIYNINLVKIRNIKYTESVNKKLVQYLKFMTSKDINELNELAKDDEVLKGGLEMLKEKSQDEEIRGGYNKEEEDERIRLTMIAEGQKAASLEIAKSLIEQKYDYNMISKTTGLSLKELQKIAI